MRVTLSLSLYPLKDWCIAASFKLPWMIYLLLYLIILTAAAAVAFLLFGNGGAVPSAAHSIQFFSLHRSGGAEAMAAKTADGSRGEQRQGAPAASSPRGTEAAAAHIESLLQQCHAPPAQQAMARLLSRECCALPVQASTVKVLHHPSEFYTELKARVGAARRSIVMSALYIGDGPLSKSLVTCLEDKIREATAARRRLTITILLDYNRMQDRRNLVTLKTLMELANSTGVRASSSYSTDDEWSCCSADDDESDGEAARGAGEDDSNKDDIHFCSAEDQQKRPAESPSVPASRATRGWPRSSTSPRGRGGCVKARLFLYESSSWWNNFLAPVSRAKEALGVQHTKLFIFDGQDTILTGANLSDDYFATRMDRYMVVEQNPLVAAWFSRLVQVLTALSHPVVCREEYVRRFDESDALGRTTEAVATSPLVFKLLHRLKGGREPQSPTLHRQSNLVILPNRLGVDPSSMPAEFCAKQKQLLHRFARDVVQLSTRDMDAAAWSTADTFLFPTVQCGRAGIYHDSAVVAELLRLSTSSTHVFLTSPYLNMHAAFVDEMLEGTMQVDCITASVQANGWSGQKGIAGYIPYFYLQLERSFYYLMKAYGCTDRIRIREYAGKGVTFHAKGLWFGAAGKLAVESASGPSSSSDLSAVVSPYLVAYGSTNYGYRSVQKDVEAEAFLLTTNEALRERLRCELVPFLQHSSPVSEESFVGAAVGRYQPVVSMLAHLGNDFL